MTQSPAIRGGPATGPPRFVLGVQVFNPSHGLGVGNLSEVTPGGRMLRWKTLYDFLFLKRGSGGLKQIILSGLPVTIQKASYPDQVGGYT
jgi:hypothetical protein